MFNNDIIKYLNIFVCRFYICINVLCWFYILVKDNCVFCMVVFKKCLLNYIIIIKFFVFIYKSGFVLVKYFRIWDILVLGDLDDLLFIVKY